MSNEKPIEIGAPIPRADACAKARGETEFAADRYGSGFLWAGVKRAGIPHGRIKRIDTARAGAIPGVVSILTFQDIRGTNRQGIIRRDQPVLADQKVRHCGDGVALIVAESREALSRAKDLITIDFEPLRGVFSIEKALEKGAPLVHEENADGNILLQGKFEQGSVASAFSECAVVVEADYELSSQEHAYLETETGWALLKEDGVIEMVVSTQTPFRDRAEISEALGLEPEKLRIIAPFCGGAFGGKDGITVQSLLALAALHCPGRPVKMWWDREESFLASVKRHPARLHYRLGAKQDGTLHALEARFYYDTGPYDHLGGAVMTLALEHAGGPYRIPHVRVQGWSVYTNNPIGGAFRGFGVPQVTAAMEQTVDQAASRLGISPLEIRVRNGVRKGDINAAGVTLRTSTGLMECLSVLNDHPAWQDREKWKSVAPPFKKRGVGIASVMHGMGYGPVVPDVGNAKIELTGEGRFRIFSGVVDMGQGNASTYLQIAGHLLNQEREQLELVMPDTAMTLPSGSASASRTTYTFGNALIGAAQILKERLFQHACRHFGTEEKEIALLPGCFSHAKTGGSLPLGRLASMIGEPERSAVFNYRCPVSEETPVKDEKIRLHGYPHLIFSYGVHLAYLEIDELTGAIEVKRYLAVSDCGKIINPQLFEQQVHGGVAQGLGYGLCESFLTDEGRILTPDLRTYILPTSLDVPDIESVSVEMAEETGPFGLKGAGEIAMDGPLPAVANAFADACGVRPLRFPLTAERVLECLEILDRKQ